jgi:YVTN family beta-propeller protein
VTNDRSTWRRPILAVCVASALIVAACGRDEPTNVDAASPTTTSSSTTTSEPTTTTTAEATTTVPETAPPTTPPPTAPPTTAPPPPPAVPTERGRYLAPNAPAARPDVNIYGNISSASMNPATAGARPLVYVPHEVSGTTSVIDPATMQVIDTFTTGAESQHVVPSWDMKTLYVVAGRSELITPIDPTTGSPGAAIPVANPYNLYFTPDGSEAIVVAEGQQRLDFRDPHTFELHRSVQTGCAGLNHLDFSADYTYFIATCEFEGTMIKYNLVEQRIVGELPIDMRPSGRTPLRGYAMPQDIRLSPDGTVFFVADLQSDGLYVIEGDSFTQVGFIPVGVGTHSLYPSRDGRTMYVINRGTRVIGGPPGGQGSVSVLDPYARTVTADWPIPGGGSPDMGNITADGTQLWLGGRYDGVVYVFDLVKGALAAKIPVGTNPHGVTVWPQPGRFSLGHTGNLR